MFSWNFWFKRVDLDKQELPVNWALPAAAVAILFVVILLLALLLPQKAKSAMLPQTCKLTHSRTYVRLCVKAIRLHSFEASVKATGSKMRVEFAYSCDNTDALTSGPAFGEELTTRTFYRSFSLPRPAIGNYVCTIILDARLLKRGGKYALHAKWTRYGIQAKAGLS